jgi:hypothetical protein
MLLFLLVDIGFSLKSVKSDCATFANGYTGQGVLTIDGCSFGPLTIGVPFLKLAQGSVKISNCQFIGISGQNDGIVIYISAGVGQSEILNSESRNIHGGAGYFAVWIASNVIIDSISLQDFDAGISGLHARSGSAAISSVSVKGVTLASTDKHVDVIWVQPSGPVSLVNLSIENSAVGGYVWSEQIDEPVIAGLTALNTQFHRQLVRNGNNRARIFNARFTSTVVNVESQSSGPVFMQGCLFEGGANSEAIGILVWNGGSLFVVGSSFQNLAHGILSDDVQAGQGFEICNCDFHNVASGIDMQIGYTVYISGCSFVGYIDGAIRINSQDISSLALVVFIVESCYFEPAGVALGKAIDVFLVGWGSSQVIRSSAFKSNASEVTVKVQGGGSALPY